MVLSSTECTPSPAAHSARRAISDSGQHAAQNLQHAEVLFVIANDIKPALTGAGDLVISFT